VGHNALLVSFNCHSTSRLYSMIKSVKATLQMKLHIYMDNALTFCKDCKCNSTPYVATIFSGREEEKEKESKCEFTRKRACAQSLQATITCGVRRVKREERKREERKRGREKEGREEKI